MTRLQSREDFYRLAVLLSELDRVLNPLARRRLGQYRVDPAPPPPLPPSGLPAADPAPAAARSAVQWRRPAQNIAQMPPAGALAPPRQPLPQPSGQPRPVTAPEPEPQPPSPDAEPASGPLAEAPQRSPQPRPASPVAGDARLAAFGQPPQSHAAADLQGPSTRVAPPAPDWAEEAGTPPAQQAPGSLSAQPGPSRASVALDQANDSGRGRFFESRGEIPASAQPTPWAGAATLAPKTAPSTETGAAVNQAENGRLPASGPQPSSHPAAAAGKPAVAPVALRQDPLPDAAPPQPAGLHPKGPPPHGPPQQNARSPATQGKEKQTAQPSFSTPSPDLRRKTSGRHPLRTHPSSVQRMARHEPRQGVEAGRGAETAPRIDFATSPPPPTTRRQTHDQPQAIDLRVDFQSAQEIISPPAGAARPQALDPGYDDPEDDAVGPQPYVHQRPKRGLRQRGRIIGELYPDDMRRLAQKIQRRHLDRSIRRP